MYGHTNIIFRCVFQKTTNRLTNKHLGQIDIPKQFLSCLKMCLPNVWKHFYTMSPDMFKTTCNTCLHHVYIHVYTLLEDLFTKYLRAFLPNIKRHIYYMGEDILTPCLKTRSHIVWNNCIYTMLEDMFQSYLKTRLHNVWMHYTCFWRSLCIMFEGLLYYVWRHVYTMFQTYLHYVWGHIHTVLKDMFTQNLLTFHKIQIGTKWCLLLKRDDNKIWNVLF